MVSRPVSKISPSEVFQVESKVPPPFLVSVKSINDVSGKTKETLSSEVNPWKHRLNLSFGQKVQVGLMSLTLAPLRFLSLLAVLLFLYLLSVLGLIGVNLEQLEVKPLEGWRRRLQGFCFSVARALFFCMGIHYVSVIGEQAHPASAPVLVVAPHATFVDTLVIVLSKATPVGKAEFKDFFLLGKIASFLQVLFVKREKAESRKNALDQIRRHVFNVKNQNHDGLWRPLLLFPEGTCTNGKALIHFKAGAFQNGVPVQPVVLRFNSRPDTLTWTWDQHYGSFGCLWLTLCQFHTKAEVEYLPVFIPTEEDIASPLQFGAKVRAIMARALDVPELDQRLEDGKLAAKASYPHPTKEEAKINVIIEEDDEDANANTIGYNYVDFTGNLTLLS